MWSNTPWLCNWPSPLKLAMQQCKPNYQHTSTSFLPPADQWYNQEKQHFTTSTPQPNCCNGNKDCTPLSYGNKLPCQNDTKITKLMPTARVASKNFCWSAMYPLCPLSLWLQSTSTPICLSHPAPHCHSSHPHLGLPCDFNTCHCNPLETVASHSTCPPVHPQHQAHNPKSHTCKNPVLTKPWVYHQQLSMYGTKDYLHLP